MFQLLQLLPGIGTESESMTLLPLSQVPVLVLMATLLEAGLPRGIQAIRSTPCDRKELLLNSGTTRNDKDPVHVSFTERGEEGGDNDSDAAAEERS